MATALFNAGCSVGALAAPLTIPLLADWFGWEMAFVIIGAFGFVWMFFWVYMYDKPQVSKHVSKEELEYINQDDKVAEARPDRSVLEKALPFFRCLMMKNSSWSGI